MSIHRQECDARLAAGPISLAATVVVYLGFALTGVAVTLLGSALPALTRQFALSDLRAGSLFAAQFLCSTLGAMFSGRLVSLCGFRVVLVGGFALIAIGIAALAFVTWPSCLLPICCYGVGVGMAIPACNLHVAAANPHRRASALNILNFVWTGGALAWAPFAAGLSARPRSFLFLGLFVALFTVCLALTRLQNGIPAQEDVRSASTPGPPVSAYLLTALLFFLYIGIESSWAGWATSYAQRMNATTRLWMFAPSFFWGALLAGRALAPIFLKRVSEDLLLILDLVLATAAGCFVLAVASMILLSAGLSVLGFALASVYPNLIARMTRDLEGNTGATGYMFAAASTGGAVLPWVVGAVSSRFGGIRTGLAVAIAASAIMLVIQISRCRRTSAAVQTASPSTAAVES